jgi:sorbitol-specific phosphotransferase system component IIA
VKALKKLESIMKKTWVRRRRIMATIEVGGKKYKVTEVGLSANNVLSVSGERKETNDNK